MAKITDFYGRHVAAGLTSIAEVPDYDGDVKGALTTTPLNWDHDDGEPYNHLHVITSVLPGRFLQDTGMVAMPYDVSGLTAGWDNVSAEGA